MQVRVKTHDLARELAASEGVIDPKTTIPVLSNILMTAVGERLELIASDMDVSVSTSCPAEVDAEGTAALPLKSLAQYARLLEPGREATISVSAKDVATLTCGDASTKFTGAGAWNYPTVEPMPEEVAASIPAEALQKAIRQTLISVSRDSARGSSHVYSSGQLEVGPGRMLLVSTDGSRLSVCETRLEGFSIRQEVSCLVPRKALVNIQKIIRPLVAGDPGKSTVDVAVKGNRAFFRAGLRTLATRLTIGRFPDYERVLPKTISVTKEIDRLELRESLSRVAKFAPQESAQVSFSLEDDELRLKARDLAIGEGQDAVRVGKDPASFAAGFSAKYILDFLDVCSAQSITVNVNEPTRPVEFNAAWDNGSQTVRYVVMPLPGEPPPRA
ncbi:MAG: DNA polymerase III subunit beta [Bryobacterales bacterium]|nr:DNA polymerase III subunit beta [Bryobacterales bacterium]